MFNVNLKQKDEDKVAVTTMIYRSDIERIREISEKTGITQQNICRTAINNLLDSIEE